MVKCPMPRHYKFRYKHPAAVYARMFDLSQRAAQMWMSLNAPFDRPRYLPEWLAVTFGVDWREWLAGQRGGGGTCSSGNR